LDAQHPATLSPAILHQLLRHEWAYEGLIITDAMDMQAVAQFGPSDSIRAALGAGADLILLGHLSEQLGLHQDFHSQENPAALARIQAAQSRWAPTENDPGLEVLACPEHQEVARRIAEESITLVKNEAGQIPLRLEPGCKIAVITPQAQNLTPADTSGEVIIELGALVAARHPGPVLALELATGGGNLAEMIEQASAAEVVIIGTINAYQDATQVALVQELSRRGKKPLVIALRIPYDVLCFPEVQSYLCTYSIRKPSIEAVVKVLWGEIIAKGVLPCNL
jgi:beta-N-acetylhexosaminidase